MKYIMFEDFSGDPVPIIFPNRIDFVEMREQIPYPTVLGAGYVQQRSSGLACHGEARELNAESRKQDAEIIAAKLETPDD